MSKFVRLCTTEQTAHTQTRQLLFRHCLCQCKKKDRGKDRGRLMANVSYKLKDLEKVVIGLGYVGENDHTRGTS